MGFMESDSCMSMDVVLCVGGGRVPWVRVGVGFIESDSCMSMGVVLCVGL